MLAIFLDIETTGLDSCKHCVVDIAFKIIDLTTTNEVASYQSLVTMPKECWDKRDPKSIEINGFTWEKVQQGKEPAEVAKEITDILNSVGVKRGEAVYICQNPAFDRAFFNTIIDVYTQESFLWPYHWLDLASMYWVSLVKGDKVPERVELSKNAIAESFHLPKENRPHTAISGVDHLIECYQAVLGVTFA